MKTKGIPNIMPGVLLAGSILLMAAYPAAASDNDDERHTRDLNITKVE